MSSAKNVAPQSLTNKEKKKWSADTYWLTVAGASFLVLADQPDTAGSARGPTACRAPGGNANSPTMRGRFLRYGESHFDARVPPAPLCGSEVTESSFSVTQLISSPATNDGRRPCGSVRGASSFVQSSIALERRKRPNGPFMP
jgi:hypothetical protein